MKIQVSGLPDDTVESDVTETFAKFGRVSNVTLVYEFGSRCCAGYGYVVMPDDGEAETAISSIGGHPIRGRTLAARKAGPDA